MPYLPNSTRAQFDLIQNAAPAGIGGLGAGGVQFRRQALQVLARNADRQEAKANLVEILQDFCARVKLSDPRAPDSDMSCSAGTAEIDSAGAVHAVEHGQLAVSGFTAQGAARRSPKPP